jgi:hypothetical protein
MSWLHIHLLINHVPVIGTVILLALLAFAVARGKPELIRAVLGGFVVLAAAGVAVYLTGEPAEEAAERLPSFSEALLEAHEEAALAATILLGALGAVALGGILAFRRKGQPISSGFARLALALAVVATTAMGYAAWRGGQLAHPEIRVGAPVALEGRVDE